MLFFFLRGICGRRPLSGSPRGSGVFDNAIDHVGMFFFDADGLEEEAIKFFFERLPFSPGHELPLRYDSDPF